MSELQKDTNADARLTSPEFWDSCYTGREQTPFDDQDWRNYVQIQLVRILENLQLDGKLICEVGGGDAIISTYLGKRHVSASFSVIDFSALGCELANRRAIHEDVKLNVYKADLFAPPQELLRYFDLVISLGVVEHFVDLAAVLSAKKRLMKCSGTAFTLIPNFSSPIYSGLCKKWSKSVFDDHVAHDMNSLITGHEKAGLVPVKSGYLGAIEFGMLSMAINGPEPKSTLDHQIYLLTTRLSKLIHFFEYKTFDLPKSKLFSPFMYVISTA